MLRDEILRLFVRVAEVLADVAVGDHAAHEKAARLREELIDALAAIKPVERLGVPFDI